MNQDQQYPIDKIIVMTLDRTPERRERWRGAAAIMQIPDEVIHFAVGHDNFTFGNNSKAIADAATVDGFPFVAEYALDEQKEGIQQTPATVAQVWNYCRILRYFIEHNETGLIIFDDKMLTIEFDQFCQLVNEVQTVKDEEFYALQLVLRGNPNEIILPEISNDQRIRTSFEIFRGMFGGNTNEYKNLFLRPGIAGYDETIIWSPAGAEWMLKCLEMAPDFYRYLDHFICQALPDLAEHQIKRKKGIYCPSELGYAFIDVFMKLGTTTDWAMEDHPVYQQSREDTHLQYIDLESVPTETVEPISKQPTPQKQPVSPKSKNIQNELEKILK